MRRAHPNGTEPQLVGRSGEGYFLNQTIDSEGKSQVISYMIQIV
jgi:hypothetical protein